MRWRWLGATLLIVGGGYSGSNAVLQHIEFWPGPLPAARDITVPRGDTAQVADSLAAQGVIAHAWELRLVALLTRNEGALRAGEFAFPAHVALRDVLTILRTARPVEHRLTIPEGLTARQIAPLFRTAEAAEGDTPPIAEGSVLPQTYFYQRGATRAALLERASAAMARALQQAWVARLPDPAIATPGEALILASIIERETARPDERAHIAAVFLNRLHAGMKLQSDPTVIYAVSDGAGVLDHPLTRAELATASPYNTYVVGGLPPGPICAPGMAALNAALHPIVSDDLYFVADGSGGHAFARSLADHRRNVLRARLDRDRPGWTQPGREAPVPTAAPVQ
jgi:UPF0755 protein